MDPDTNLLEQRSIARRIKHLIDSEAVYSQEDMIEDLDRLAELIDALDGWLSKGGYLPERWKREGPCA